MQNGPFAQDLGCGLTPTKRLDLLILPPASTLQVFHFMIGRFRILCERAGLGLRQEIRDFKRGA